MAILSGAQAEVQPIPEGYHTVMPGIVVNGVAALIDYLKIAFDAEETARTTNADGTISHAEIKIGDSFIMLSDAHENWPASPGFFRLYMEDGDAVYRRAIEAGGKPVTEMTGFASGDQVRWVSDPAGNIWWIQMQAEAVDLGETNQQAQEPTPTDDETATLVAGS